MAETRRMVEHDRSPLYDKAVLLLGHAADSGDRQVLRMAWNWCCDAGVVHACHCEDCLLVRTTYVQAWWNMGWLQRKGGVM